MIGFKYQEEFMLLCFSNFICCKSTKENLTHPDTGKAYKMPFFHSISNAPQCPLYQSLLHLIFVWQEGMISVLTPSFDNSPSNPSKLPSLHSLKKLQSMLQSLEISQ